MRLDIKTKHIVQVGEKQNELDCSRWYTIANILSLTLTLRPRSNKTAQFPLHQVFYAPAKFGVAVSNGVDVFTRNTLFDLDLRSYIMLPCTLYSMDIYTCKV